MEDTWQPAEHLEVLGLGCDSREQCGRFIDAVHELADTVQLGDRVLHSWQDAAGGQVHLEAVGERMTGWQLAVSPHPAARPVELYDVSPVSSALSLVLVEVEEIGRIPLVAQVTVRSVLGFESGPVAAHLTALGLAVQVHDGPEAFAASDASAWPSNSETAEQESPRITRFSTTSVMPRGDLVDPQTATARTWVSGVVTASELRTSGAFGQLFQVLLVRCAGFDLTVALRGVDHPGPIPVGAVVSGVVLLSAVVEVDELDAVLTARAGQEHVGGATTFWNTVVVDANGAFESHRWASAAEVGELDV